MIYYRTLLNYTKLFKTRLYKTLYNFHKLYTHFESLDKFVHRLFKNLQTLHMRKLFYYTAIHTSTQTRHDSIQFSNTIQHYAKLYTTVHNF